MTTVMDLRGFEAALEKDGIVLIDFWASWRAPVPCVVTEE